MNILSKEVIFILMAAGLALALRLPRLDKRPMHTDEAVHGIRFGALLEEGNYQYDPVEFHGPTLNYLTLIPAWLKSETRLTDVSETTLRTVPVVFGTALVLMLMPLGSALGRMPQVSAGLLTAISPAMVFCSRYYIHEMLLVCFTFGAIVAGYQFYQNRNMPWAIATGLFLGLMHATKETCVISYGAMLVALGGWHFVRRKGNRQNQVGKPGLKIGHAVAATIAGLLVSALFFSSFLSHPTGITDSLLAYKTYFSRAGHAGFHEQPWYFYLKMLMFSRFGSGPVWSEALIVVLAVIGTVSLFKERWCPAKDRNLAWFLAFYTMIIAVIYSVIPYKTPWSMLSVLHGLILMAGLGAAFLFKIHAGKSFRLAVTAILAGAAAHLAWQAYSANFRYFDDPRNPYVYSHPQSEIYELVSRTRQIANVHPDGYRMPIDVIFPDGDYWPLPWYLRAFQKVGWWRHVNEQQPAAPVIIAAPAFEPDLSRKLYELPPPGHKDLYVPLCKKAIELRPGVGVRAYVKKDLWDKFYYQEGEAVPAQAR